jgi:hypothetical protein
LRDRRCNPGAVPQLVSTKPACWDSKLNLGPRILTFWDGSRLSCSTRNPSWSPPARRMASVASGSGLAKCALLLLMSGYVRGHRELVGPIIGVASLTEPSRRARWSGLGLPFSGPQAYPAPAAGGNHSGPTTEGRPLTKMNCADRMLQLTAIWGKPGDRVGWRLWSRAAGGFFRGQTRLAGVYCRSPHS